VALYLAVGVVKSEEGVHIYILEHTHIILHCADETSDHHTQHDEWLSHCERRDGLGSLWACFELRLGDGGVRMGAHDLDVRW
jgi:hypothetical protein